MEHQSSIRPGGGGFRWQLAMPGILALIGAFLLVGCFYVPLPEHPATGEQDYRTVLGTADSHKPLRIGVATRDSVVTLLGASPYVSEDGRSIAYAFKTVGSQWVWPLCFHAEPATEGYYAVRLRFDDRDVLAGWDIAHAAEQYSFYPVHPLFGPRAAIEKLDLQGSKLRQVRSGHHQ